MEPLFLCIECGAAYAGAQGGKRCAGCGVELIDMQMAQSDDRLRVLVSLAEARRLRRVESHGMLGGCLLGAVLGVGLLWRVPDLAVMAFAVPLLATLLVSLAGWLLWPLLIERLSRTRRRPLSVPPGRHRKKLLTVAASVATIAIVPLWLVVERQSSEARPASIIVLHDGDASWQERAPGLLQLMQPQLQALAVCVPETCGDSCGAASVSIDVGAMGEVSDVQLSAPSSEAGCIRRVAMAWRFPASPSGMPYALELPFVFTRADERAAVAFPTVIRTAVRRRGDAAQN